MADAATRSGHPGVRRPDRGRAARAAGGLKWTRYGSAIGAFVAEMDFGTAPAVTRGLHDAVDGGRLGYLTPEAAADMARACADWQPRRYGWEVPPAWITPLADVVAGLQAAIEQFTPAGHPVVLPDPGVHAVPRRPRGAGPRADPGAHGRARRPARATTSTASPRAFERGARLLRARQPAQPARPRLRRSTSSSPWPTSWSAAGARVFSDEIHAPLVHPGAVHRPYASLSAATARHTVTATSASKAWNLPGLKAAQLILSDADGRRALGGVGFLFGHGASTPGVLASTAAYDAGGDWLDGVLAYLDGNRRLPRRPARRAAARGPVDARRRAPTSPGWTAARSGCRGFARAPSSSTAPASRWSTGRSAAPRARATCGSTSRRPGPS